MKQKKFNKLIQGPLRFHHQDIHEELDEVKALLRVILHKLENEKFTEIVENPIKYELNNTTLKWNNEYKFVPAGQDSNSVIKCDGYSTTEGLNFQK